LSTRQVAKRGQTGELKAAVGLRRRRGNERAEEKKLSLKFKVPSAKLIFANCTRLHLLSSYWGIITQLIMGIIDLVRVRSSPCPTWASPRSGPWVLHPRDGRQARDGCVRWQHGQDHEVHDDVRPVFKVFLQNQMVLLG
jgi:hypothetical protein